MKQHNLFLLEPNENYRTRISAILKQHFNLYYATNGHHAIENIKLQQPELIICSLELEKMNCFLFNSLIKECPITAEIPVLLIYDTYSSVISTHALKNGMDGTITYKTPSEEIIAQIENLISIRDNLKRIYQNDTSLYSDYTVESQTNRIFIDQLDQLILANISNLNLNVDFICEHLGMSKSLLQAKTKRSTCETLGKYISLARLRKAQDLLLHSDLLIYEIAEKVGFGSKQSFIKSFKKHVSCLPSVFRKHQNATLTSANFN